MLGLGPLCCVRLGQVWSSCVALDLGRSGAHSVALDLGRSGAYSVALGLEPTLLH